MQLSFELSPQKLPKTSAREFLDGIAQPSFKDSLQSVDGSSKVSASNPANAIGEFIREVSTTELQAAEMRNEFLSGGPVSLHQTMIASQEASVSFSLMVEMRNKVMEAYQELMRIQI